MALRAFEGGRPVLCLVTARGLGPVGLEAAVEAAVAAGVDWVQIRERGLEGRELLEEVDRLAEAARRGAERRGGAARILVNRRVDVALAAGADGVHLGFDALDPGEARALLGPEALVGVSTHSVDEVREAAAARAASYAHLAPIFAPLSKPARGSPLGTRALREAAGAGLPVIAQGGIEPSRIGEVIAAGAAGVAVTGAILGAHEPGEAARRLREALDRAARPESERSSAACARRRGASR